MSYEATGNKIGRSWSWRWNQLSSRSELNQLTILKLDPDRIKQRIEDHFFRANGPRCVEKRYLQMIHPTIKLSRVLNEIPALTSFPGTLEVNEAGSEAMEDHNLTSHRPANMCIILLKSL